MLYDTYATRVREVHFQEASSVPVSPFVYFQLARMRPPTNPPVPFLKAISLSPGIKVEPTLLLALPGHLTERLSFNDPEQSYTNDFLLSLLATLQHCPDLKHLTLTGPHTSGVDAVATYSHLRSLTLLMPARQHSHSFLQSLGRLNHLRKVTLHAGPPSHRISDQTCVLPALQYLKLLGHPSSMASILGVVQPINLQDFIAEEEEVETETSQTAPVWTLLFSRLATLSHLRSIEINQCSNRTWGQNGYSLTTEIMVPLAQLPNPSALHGVIVRNGAVGIELISLRQLMLAFRYLKIFRLPLRDNASNFRILSLTGVVWNIIEKCPDLETLQIPFMERPRDLTSPLIRAPQPRGGPHRLRELFFNNNPASLLHNRPEDALHFAEFLDTAFPNLQSLILPDGENEEWAWVEKMTLALQRARRRTQVI